MAGINLVGIESNGNIKGCLSIQPGNCKRSADFVEGNIREESIEDIWNRPTAFSYTRNWSREDLTGNCRSCEKVSICKGGCTFTRVASGNGTDNPMCVYLHQSEEQPSPVMATAKTAAALVLASLVGLASQGCEAYGG